MSEKDLASFLFNDGSDIKVFDIKFLKGRDASLSREEHCAIANRILSGFFAGQKPERLPEGRTAQRNIADVLESR